MAYRGKITFFFTNTNSAGWTETYYTNAPDNTLALAAARVLLPARVGLMGRGPWLKFIRVSDDTVPRDSKIFPVPEGDGMIKSRAVESADIASTCVDVRIEATDFFRRTLFLRGNPDDICTNNGDFTPTVPWRTNFAVFQTIMLGGAFALRRRVNVGLPVNITNVSTTGPTGLVTITTAAPHGLLQNDVANIRGVQGATQVRGLQKVNSVTDATNFIVRIPRVGKPYLGAGNVVKNDYQLTGLSGVQAVRCSHHNAGRPFDVPRGRRLVR